MREIVDYYRAKGIIFRSLKPINLKDLGSRKKVSIYLGVDLKGYYSMIMLIDKKSRILRKEAKELMDLHYSLERFMGTKILKKYILIKAPLCSKAKMILEENSWKVAIP